MTRETSCYRSSYRRDATDELRKSSKRDASGVRRVRVRDQESVTTERNCTRHCSLPTPCPPTRMETCRVQGAGERERRERVEHSCCVKDAPRERGRRIAWGERSVAEILFSSTQQFVRWLRATWNVDRAYCTFLLLAFQVSRDAMTTRPPPAPTPNKDGAFSAPRY